MNKIAAIDIGNSRIKILYREQFIAIDNNTDFLDLVNQFFDTFHEFPDIIGISSVNRKIYKDLYDKLSPRCKIFDQNYLLQNQNLINFSNIEGIGTDRVFGMIGALKYFKAPLITVDCGTAVTINYVDRDLNCRGGVIFAGPYTQSKALSEYTDSLFETDLIADDKIVATNTKMALNNGIIYSIGLSIIALSKEISKLAYPEKLNIIITGGSFRNLKFIFEKNNFEFKYIQNLVLEGIINCIDNLVFTENDK